MAAKMAIANLKSCRLDVPVSCDSVAIPFESDDFEGSVCLVPAQYHSASDHFEIQIQGRFKTAPNGNLSCGVQVPPVPRILKPLLKSLNVTNIPNKKCDFITMPIMQSARVCRSFEPISLPVQFPAEAGTWEWLGKWTDTNWRAAGFDRNHYYAFSFGSSFIDCESWKVANIPALGSISLERWWGKKSCVFKLLDGCGISFVELELLPPSMRRHVGAERNVNSPLCRIDPGSPKNSIDPGSPKSPKSPMSIGSSWADDSTIYDLDDLDDCDSDEGNECEWTGGDSDSDLEEEVPMEQYSTPWESYKTRTSYQVDQDIARATGVRVSSHRGCIGQFGTASRQPYKECSSSIPIASFQVYI